MKCTSTATKPIGGREVGVVPFIVGMGWESGVVVVGLLLALESMSSRQRCGLSPKDALLILFRTSSCRAVVWGSRYLDIATPSPECQEAVKFGGVAFSDRLHLDSSQSRDKPNGRIEPIRDFLRGLGLISALRLGETAVAEMCVCVCGTDGGQADSSPV